MKSESIFARTAGGILEERAASEATDASERVVVLRLERAPETFGGASASELREFFTDSVSTPLPDHGSRSAISDQLLAEQEARECIGSLHGGCMKIVIESDCEHDGKVEVGWELED